MKFIEKLKSLPNPDEVTLTTHELVAETHLPYVELEAVADETVPYPISKAIDNLQNVQTALAEAGVDDLVSVISAKHPPKPTFEQALAVIKGNGYFVTTEDPEVIKPKPSSEVIDPKDVPIDVALASLSAHGLHMGSVNIEHHYTPNEFPSIDLNMTIYPSDNSVVQALHEWIAHGLPKHGSGFKSSLKMPSFKIGG